MAARGVGVRFQAASAIQIANPMRWPRQREWQGRRAVQQNLAPVRGSRFQLLAFARRNPQLSVGPCSAVALAPSHPVLNRTIIEDRRGSQMPILRVVACLFALLVLASPAPGQFFEPIPVAPQPAIVIVPPAAQPTSAPPSPGKCCHDECSQDSTCRRGAPCPSTCVKKCSPCP
jgi:hypothetical protein